MSEDTGPNIGLTLPQTGDWRAQGGCRAESECVLLTLATAEKHRSQIVFWFTGEAAVLAMQCQGGVNQLVAPSDQTEKNSTEMGWCGCDCWCHSLVGSNLILMVSWGWVWDCDLSHSTADLGPQFPSKHDIVTIHTEKEREEWPTQDSPFLLHPVQDSMINYILSCAWG